MKMKVKIVCYLLGGAAILAGSAAQAQLINGNFATGDLTGWTLMDTPNGGTAVVQVVQFDTAGTGVPTYSAEFEVGETSGGIGGGGLGQGAGIFQNVALGAGELKISLNIAATSEGNNADAGTFELLLNGDVVDSDAFGGISVGQIPRSTLSYSGTVTAGTYQIGIDMFRGYGTEYPSTPFQYLSDVQLSLTPVPEPSAMVICGAGILALAGFRYGRRLPVKS
jgi:hypothetical protein